MANDERRTPRWLFDKINEQFRFTIDVASTDENALVERHWTKNDNGLWQPWRESERIWCNPPYSRGQLIEWITKAVYADALVVMLIPGDCSTVASQMALANGKVLFLNKRIAFDDEKSGAKFCNWLVLFNGGARDERRLVRLDMGVVR